MKNTIRPDDVIPPDGSSVQSRRTLSDALLLLPNFLKLIARLLKDPRVPRRAKISIGVAAAYVASPIDLIPEVVPVLGWMDDVLVVMMALDSLIARAGADIVEEHWDGPGDILVLIREAIAASRALVPKRISSILDRISG